MKINIYYNRNYIPFNLYISSLCDILTLNNFKISIIKDIQFVENDSDFVILFKNDLRDVFPITNKKIIFINADCILNYSKETLDNFDYYVKFVNPNNIYIWEYNKLNIDYYINNNLQNIKWYFIPLLYNKTLETIYNNSVIKIKYEDKPIDVLFIGNISSRREILLSEVKTKFKTVILSGSDNLSEFVNAIENSKIVINIYSKEFNKPFDYYRLALLYSNKILVITEEYENYDLNIEKNLIELEKIVIKCKYDNIIEKISEYLNKNVSEIEDITEKTYTLFKNSNMSSYILDFFEKQNDLK